MGTMSSQQRDALCTAVELAEVARRPSVNKE